MGLLVIIGVRAWVPQLPGLKDTGFRGQFRFLKFPAPWLIFLAIVLGNGGMFCWYSYISPFMGKVAGIDSVHMTLVMALAGLGMVLGNALSGRLSIRFPPTGIAEGMLAVMGTALLLVFFSGQHAAAALALMFICTACLFGVSAPQQMLCCKRQRRGNARRRPGAGGLQYRQCHRGLLRRALHCRRARLRQYGPDRSAVRRRGVFCCFLGYARKSRAPPFWAIKPFHLKKVLNLRPSWARMPQMSFELFVALRYLFSRRKQTFIYIISLMSILGVAIGVGALVVVLGVYNGLTTDMRDKILGANAHAIVMSYVPSAFEHDQDLTQRIRSVDGVTGATPFIYTK